MFIEIRFWLLELANLSEDKEKFVLIAVDFEKGNSME